MNQKVKVLNYNRNLKSEIIKLQEEPEKWKY